MATDETRVGTYRQWSRDLLEPNAAASSVSPSALDAFRALQASWAASIAPDADPGAFAADAGDPRRLIGWFTDRTPLLP